MTDSSGFRLSNHPLVNHSERPRGIFTAEGDRSFLINHEGAPSDRAEYGRHEEIRKRLLHGIIDFQLAHRHLGEWNWKKLLDLQTSEERGLRNGMAAAMALFYEIHREKDWSFENTLYHAIDDAYSTGPLQRTMPQKRLESVALEVEASEPEDYGATLERVSQKIIENAELTDSEVRFAAQQGWYKVLDNYFSKERRRERQKEATREHYVNKMPFGEFEEEWEKDEEE